MTEDTGHDHCNGISTKVVRKNKIAAVLTNSVPLQSKILDKCINVIAMAFLPSQSCYLGRAEMQGVWPLMASLLHSRCASNGCVRFEILNTNLL